MSSPTDCAETARHSATLRETNYLFIVGVHLTENQFEDDLENLRMMTKVSHLYYNKSMVQTEIAKTLGLSQARVSRLLTSAEDKRIVRKVVVPPKGLFSEAERKLEEKFGLSQAHVIDGEGEEDRQLTESLGVSLASIFEVMPLDGKNIGFTSWSRSMREFANSLSSLPRAGAKRIVEMLGGVGDPALQHQATSATEKLASLTGAEALFLRVPGVVSSKEMKAAILDGDPHALAALDALNNLDIALIGVGPAKVEDHMQGGSNFFTNEQVSLARESGAVGEINLRFIDKDGVPVDFEYDENVIGISLQQLKNVPVRIAVAGGESKRESVLGVVRGGWITVLITDTETANYLLETG